MREILFKAKRIDNGEWVEGYLVPTRLNTYHDGYRIIEENGINYDELDYYEPSFISYVIGKDTICQYTGLTDKNGQKIWENDVVQYCDCTVENYVIAWEADKACFEYQQYGCSIMNFDELSGIEVEVIGNIFDNPELISE